MGELAVLGGTLLEGSGLACAKEASASLGSNNCERLGLNPICGVS